MSSDVVSSGVISLGLRKYESSTSHDAIQNSIIAIRQSKMMAFIVFFITFHFLRLSSAAFTGSKAIIAHSFCLCNLLGRFFDFSLSLYIILISLYFLFSIIFEKSENIFEFLEMA